MTSIGQQLEITNLMNGIIALFELIDLVFYEAPSLNDQ